MGTYHQGMHAELHYLQRLHHCAQLLRNLSRVGTAACQGPVGGEHVKVAQ
jgi:hypothetical protein